jgi:enoyl-CoA hydratase/carnithine racemase
MTLSEVARDQWGGGPVKEKMLRPLVSTVGLARRQYYTGPVVPLDQIKEELAAVGGGGGSVDLVKDDRTGIARLTLNSPKSCNALSGSMMVRLADIMDELSVGNNGGSWPEGRGLILTAAKNSANIFCAGGDLATVRRIGTHEQGFKMALLMNQVTRQLRSLPLITVALLDGSAVGGGAELVSCTDHRLVTPHSHVTFVQARVNYLQLVPTYCNGAMRLATRLNIEHCHRYHQIWILAFQKVPVPVAISLKTGWR